MKNVIIRNHLR